MKKNHLGGIPRGFRTRVPNRAGAEPLFIVGSSVVATVLVGVSISQPTAASPFSPYWLWTALICTSLAFLRFASPHLATQGGSPVNIAGEGANNPVGVSHDRRFVAKAVRHQDGSAQSDHLSAVPLNTSRSPVQSVDLSSPSLSYLVAKRSFDLIVALFATVVTIALLPVIALAIKADSPGPVFYGQRRVGQHGREFQIIKFRSMRTDAEQNGAVWAQEGDPRVTRVGRFMRRARIDELPQLWNVIRGDMTLVGPRPERPEFTSILQSELPGYAHRHSVKPGLTGWAQIRYRYASSVQDTGKKLEYDLYYVTHRSLLFDIKILFLTIPVILHMRGF